MKKNSILLLLLTMLLLAVVYSLLTSCTRTVKESLTSHDTLYVATHSVDTVTIYDTTTDTVYVAKTDTLVKMDVERDSIVIRDSIFIREKGDSIYIYREKWRTKVDIRHDTVYKAKRDTIYKIKDDTVMIYRYIERGDTTASSSTADKETVKERRTWGWMRMLLWTVGILAVVSVAWKFLKK